MRKYSGHVLCEALLPKWKAEPDGILCNTNVEGGSYNLVEDLDNSNLIWQVNRMASYEDAKAGWEIFKAYRFAASREEINRKLTREGFSPISERTFRHYHKLKRYGYDRYVPINQLDVKTLKDPLLDKAVRSRYTSIPDFSDVIVSFSNFSIHVTGIAVHLSAATITCRFTRPDATNFLKYLADKRTLLHQPVLVHFPHSKKSFHAIVESVEALDQEHTIVQFSFYTLAPIDMMTKQRTALESTQISFRITPTDESIAFVELTHKLYWLFHTLEASRLVSEAILLNTPAGEYFVVPTTRIKSIEMHSPASGVLVAAIPAAVILMGIATIWLGVRDEANRETSRKHRHKRQLTLSEIQANELLSTAADSIKNLAGVHFEISVAPRAIEVFEQQLLPAANQLFSSNTGTVEIMLSPFNVDKQA